MTRVNMGTGNIFVHDIEDQHAHSGVDQPCQETADMLREIELFREQPRKDVRVQHRTGEKEHHHKRGQDGDADDDAPCLEQIAVSLYLPDIVEHLAYGEHQRQHNPDEGGHGDEAEESGFGGVDDIVGRPQQRLDNAFFAQIGIQDIGELFLEAQTVCQVQADGKGRHDGKHAAEGQGGDLIADFLVRESIQHQDDGFGVFDQASFPAGEILFSEQPDIMGDEAHDPGDPDGNPPDQNLNLMHQALEH